MILPLFLVFHALPLLYFCMDKFESAGQNGTRVGRGSNVGEPSGRLG